MASSKFENMWKLMSQHNFEVDGNMSTSILCTICFKLLIEPYSAICGCHFCGTCIRKFQIDGDKYCPGKGSECNNTLLEINKNVVIDFTTQFSIAKLIVKCPYHLCSKCFELEKIEEHIRFCSMRPMSCPYQSIGCQDRGISSTSVQDHLISDALAHSQLLIEALNNLKNDINNDAGSKTIEIKDEEFLRKEIGDLKEIMRGKDEVIRDLKNEIDIVKSEAKVPKVEIEKLQKETEKNSLELSRFKEEYSVFKTAMGVLQKDYSTSAAAKGDISEDSLQKMTTKTEEMTTDIGNVKKSVEKISKTVEKDVEKKIKKSEIELSAAKTAITKNTEEMKKLDFRLNELTVRTTKDFVWKVNTFSKTVFPLCSNKFVKNYYKFALNLTLEGHKLRLNLRVLKGEFDDHVEWPINQTVTLGIVNQNTMLVYKSDKYCFGSATGEKSGFNRPINDLNCPIGSLSVQMKELKNTLGILLNDSLILFCAIGT